MNKVAAFVVDRLDFFHHQVAPVLPRNVSHTSLASHNSAQSASSTLKPAYLNRQPEEIVELICGNTVVPPRATLAAVRQYAFKKSGELVLHYRLRAP
jgi:WD repeat-containing protein 48